MTRAVNTEPLFHPQIVKYNRKRAFMNIQMNRIELWLSNPKESHFTEREDLIRTGCVAKAYLQI
jgi:hypothetical protein